MLLVWTSVNEWLSFETDYRIKTHRAGPHPQRRSVLNRREPILARNGSPQGPLQAATVKRLLAIVGLVLFACGPTQASTAMSPSPSTWPSRIRDLPLSKVDLSCRLPVVTRPAQSSPGVTFHGGFITFPAAQLADDAAGTTHYRNVEADFATTATPVLYGDGVVPFYDRVQSRWVPARARQALADGSAYPYTTYNSQTGLFTAFVVNVASGSSRSFKVPSVQSPEVADFGAAGVYIVSSSGLGGPGEGVWLLDPKTGAITQLGQIHRVWAVRDDYAWVARFDSRDKTAWPPSELAPANSLVRIDLATSAETIWFYRAGSYPWLLDLDSHNRPVVLLGGGGKGNEVLLLDRPGSPGHLVYSGNIPLDYLQGDGDRLWFGGSRGIYLYTPDRGFRKVFAYHADPATSDRIEPAGFCR